MSKIEEPESKPETETDVNQETEEDIKIKESVANVTNFIQQSLSKLKELQDTKQIYTQPSDLVSQGLDEISTVFHQLLKPIPQKLEPSEPSSTKLEKSENDEELDMKVEKIFTNLIQENLPKYGFSLDENLLKNIFKLSCENKDDPKEYFNQTCDFVKGLNLTPGFDGTELLRAFFMDKLLK